MDIKWCCPHQNDVYIVTRDLFCCCVQKYHTNTHTYCLKHTLNLKHVFQNLRYEGNILRCECSLRPVLHWLRAGERFASLWTWYSLSFKLNICYNWFHLNLNNNTKKQSIWSNYYSGKLVWRCFKTQSKTVKDFFKHFRYSNLGFGSLFFY